MNANKVWTPQYNGIGVLEKHAAENILDVINSTCC